MAVVPTEFRHVKARASALATAWLDCVQPSRGAGRPCRLLGPFTTAAAMQPGLPADSHIIRFAYQQTCASEDSRTGAENARGCASSPLGKICGTTLPGLTQRNGKTAPRRTGEPVDGTKAENPMSSIHVRIRAKPVSGTHCLCGHALRPPARHGKIQRRPKG